MEKQDVPKKRNPFILSILLFSTIWKICLLLTIVYCLITCIALAYTNGFVVWSIWGYNLGKFFIMIWVMFAFIILLKILYDFLIKQKEKQIKTFEIRRNILKEEIKKELKKKMNNGRNTKRR